MAQSKAHETMEHVQQSFEFFSSKNAPCGALYKMLPKFSITFLLLSTKTLILDFWILWMKLKYPYPILLFLEAEEW